MTLSVLGTVSPAAPDDRAHHHRDRLLSAEHGLPLRGVVDELVHRQQHEVDAVMHDQRPHPEGRRADARPGERVLGQGAFHHALRAELLEGAGQGPPHGPGVDDPDADEKYVLVALHGEKSRVTHRLSKLHRVALSRDRVVGHGAA
jgi:hypothetical protein